MTSQPAQLQRVSTGIGGLDRILSGGLVRGSVCIVEGPPGSGKTILGNQMCHYQAAGGQQVVYLTLLAESHTRMIAHLRGLSFFRADLVAKRVHYVSGFKVLEGEGLPGLLRVIRETVTPRQTALLVVDGLVTALAAAPSKHDYEKFVHELQALAALTDCTVLLLVNGDGARPPRPEDTIVDAIIQLTDGLAMPWPIRHLEIKKLRGSDHVRGKHTLEIDHTGIRVLPRIEAERLRLPENARLDAGGERASFGTPGLDAMLRGGLPASSTTMVLGPTGSGKTILALQFLSAGAEQGEPGLFFGFFERPYTLLEKSRRLRLALASPELGGLIRLAWEPFGEGSLDALGERLLRLVDEHRPKRLCIDGIQGFAHADQAPGRTAAVLATLVEELQARHVTAVYTAEARELIEPIVRSPVTGVSALTHNLILLRQVELGGRLRKLLSVLKLRDSDFDPRPHQLEVVEGGLLVGPPLAELPPDGPGRPEAATPSPPLPPAVAQPSPQAPHVVIVDDEFGLAELIAELLTEKGYTTSIAINGELGVALLRERRPDLVLVDLMMPVLNGTEMLRRMQADPDLASIPVVLMTALPEAVPSDEPPGYQAVLQKPFTPEHLFDVVRSVVGTPAVP